jgi:hypothetical protein
MNLVVNKEISNARIQICESCEFYGANQAETSFVNNKLCQKCNCFMPVKTTLATAKCPIGKWGADEKSQTQHLQ